MILTSEFGRVLLAKQANNIGFFFFILTLLIGGCTVLLAGHRASIVLFLLLHLGVISTTRRALSFDLLSGGCRWKVEQSDSSNWGRWCSRSGSWWISDSRRGAEHAWCLRLDRCGRRRLRVIISGAVVALDRSCVG